MRPVKMYLGDGVYVDYDGESLILTAENGLKVLSRIVLDGRVYRNLLDYIDKLRPINRVPLPDD